MQTTHLETAQLGSTGLEITRVGFGAWAIGGGGWEFGWGPQQDVESIEAIERALEFGVNWIDTAAALGVRLGPAGRRRVDRGDPARARARRQLDRHRGRLRLRPLRGGRRASARRVSTSGRTCSRRRRCSRGRSGASSTA